MQKQPILILFIAFILGITIQNLSDWSLRSIALLSTAAIVLLLTSYLSHHFYFYKLRPVFISFFSLCMGVGAHYFHSKPPLLPALDSREVMSFKLSKKLNSNDKNRRYEVIAWKGNLSFQSVVSIPRREPELDYTHYYQSEFYINHTENKAYDFQFDYEKYLRRKGIYFQSYISGPIKAQVRNDLSWGEDIKQRRLAVLQKIDRSTLQKKNREFIKGIILADRSEMDRLSLRDFRDSGMMHILAISGTHVAIIFGLILFILHWILPPKYRVLKVVIALVLIWSFAFFIDFGNSVVRSCIMISTYYVFYLLQRKTDLLHSLALAGIIILIINSNQLFDVGFQLSFAAVFGIFWFNQPILKLFPKTRTKFQHFMLNIFSISMSAQLATLPLVIFYFHQYSALSIVANLVIIPFAEIIIIFSLVMVFLIAVSVNLPLLNGLFENMITFTLDVIHFFATHDFAMSRRIPLTVVELLVLCIFIFILRFPLKKIKLKYLFRLIGIALLFSGLRVYLNVRANDTDEILVHQLFREKVISVKKGPRVVFYCSEKANVAKVYQYLIEPYLAARRTQDYELIINSDALNAIPRVKHE